MYCLTRLKKIYDTRNKAICIQQGKVYYTGKNKIIDSVFRPGFSFDVNDAFKFDSQMQAMNALQRIEKSLGFTSDEDDYFMVALLDSDNSRYPALLGTA